MLEDANSEVGDTVEETIEQLWKGRVEDPQTMRIFINESTIKVQRQLSSGQLLMHYLLPHGQGGLLSSCQHVL